jgi:hypothetical protein
LVFTESSQLSLHFYTPLSHWINYRWSFYLEYSTAILSGWTGFVINDFLGIVWLFYHFLCFNHIGLNLGLHFHLFSGFIS